MSTFNNKLQEIIDYKQQEVVCRKHNCSFSKLQEKALNIGESKSRGFINSLQQSIVNTNIAVIAEIKKASPSKGLLCKDFDPSFIAKDYEKNGAACLSVLTDEKFFQGHDNYLLDVKSATNLAILRKDFMVDDYQILESKVLGADCVLLIVAVLTDKQLYDMYYLAQSLNLDVLLEVHNLVELRRALKLNPAMVGINNRNLSTFVTDIRVTGSLLEHIPESLLVVTESGISDINDVSFLTQIGIKAFLVGECFMREKYPGNKLRELFYLK